MRRFCVVNPCSAGMRYEVGPNRPIRMPETIQNTPALVRRDGRLVYHDRCVLFLRTLDNAQILVWVALTDYVNVNGARSVNQVLTTMASVIQQALNMIHPWVCVHLENAAPCSF